ncbi:uncharacterized protein LOC110834523 [Zootermopsis nevadensis]|uniref:uncharacterized protein LOC110834523 n=1 Tax=Zootermopsis nevadensis TaxID=136037 RepID=UPI000B8E2E2D|nr:uncharacterized protein LOC110834523 [Zootermopsis nevadensis]
MWSARLTYFRGLPMRKHDFVGSEGNRNIYAKCFEGYGEKVKYGFNADHLSLESPREIPSEHGNSERHVSASKRSLTKLKMTFGLNTSLEKLTEVTSTIRMIRCGRKRTFPGVI